MVTEAQLKYIRDLGGDVVHAAKLTRVDASSYIDELRRKPKAVQPVTVPPAPVEDPRLTMAKTMLTTVADGYYATQKEEGASVFFMRLSRPKTGKYAGGIKVQSVHGSPIKPTLMDAMLYFPDSGKYYFEGRYSREAIWREKLIESILFLVTDSWGCQRRYAEKMERCCRCNASLTDDRSRHYGIGPECEKHWPHIIEQVDLEDALKA